MSEQKTSAAQESVILTRLQDAVEAGALRAFLEGEGIAVSTPGLQHRGVWGFLGAYIEIMVRVPRGDLERAQGLYAAWKEAAEPAVGDAPRTDRLGRIAVFAACTVTFGAGHFYARRVRVGALIAVIELTCLGLALAFPAFWYAIPGIILADAIGSVLLIQADQRGQTPSAVARLAPVVALTALALVPGFRFAFPAALAGNAMVTACTRAADCDGTERASECIERAAARAFAGEDLHARDAQCANCLEESLCVDMREDCFVCTGLVMLPAEVDRMPGPTGTSPDDMQFVVPSLFGHPESGDAPDHDLEELLRGLDEPPPR